MESRAWLRQSVGSTLPCCLLSFLDFRLFLPTRKLCLDDDNAQKWGLPKLLDNVITILNFPILSCSTLPTLLPTFHIFFVVT